jgi:ATP synthase protein I
MTGNGNHEPLLNGLRRRRQRQREWEQSGERSLLRSLGNVGALGWLIVAPMLGGVALGRWLDGRFGAGVTFTGALLMAGVALGGWLAWRRMHQE